MQENQSKLLCPSTSKKISQLKPNNKCILRYNTLLLIIQLGVRVFVAQKRALRLIFGLTYRDSCCQTFHRYKIMPVLCIYIYKFIMYIKSNLHLTRKSTITIAT
nr:unnamed protein product [Callosobruchus chinensis]